MALVLAPVRRRYGDPLGRKGGTPFGNDEDKDIERIDHTVFGWPVSTEDTPSVDIRSIARRQVIQTSSPGLSSCSPSPPRTSTPLPRPARSRTPSSRSPPEERAAAVRALRASGEDYLKRTLAGYRTFKPCRTRGEADVYLAR